MGHKFFLFTFLLFGQMALAADIGTISKVRGEVEIMSSSKKEGSSPVVYEGHELFMAKASPGDDVKKGDIVRTGRASLARVLFENGDQFMIGPGSEYQLTRPSKSAKEGSLINLARGKFRAVISKDGPRNNMEVKTDVASMGVRGTDFFVESLNYRESEVSVFRGEVSIDSIDDDQASKIVRSGFLGEAKRIKSGAPKKSEKKTPKKKDEVETTVKKTSKQKVANIHKETDMSEVSRGKLTEEKKEKIRKLEIQAIKATLKDIRHYDPSLFKQIQKEKKVSSAEQINTKVTSKVFKEAPEEEKLTKDQIERLQNDPYGQYFDVESP